ncbi:hypothetical protein RFI_12405 [Reticulomyxa filosa]|uniref:Uncharacterized protein n=1 Tax=Reticulomyxa filosa TaxID=46433 RepID=X6NFK5_RETFI|nr:hypothetical protein RFI_12405 [Reticulomyxa filosa]|eukprot:ETO24756.1 hypothetical protein RFI_12405 [Reticulomyxa filosa]
MLMFTFDCQLYNEKRALRLTKKFRLHKNNGNNGSFFFFFRLVLALVLPCENTKLRMVFDLSPLKLTQSSQLDYYSVKDARYGGDDNTEDEFVYKFNICGKVSIIPSECSGSYDWCEKIEGKCNMVPISGAGMSIVHKSYKIKTGEYTRISK